MIDFFRERLPGLESIPSHDTFNRFFSALNPEYLNVFSGIGRLREI
ncbi:transposase family protein [Bacteroides sp.]